MRIKEDSAMLPSVHEPIVDFHPPHYVCRRTRIPLGEPDGRLDKPFWEQAPWTSPFHDIEGDSRPAPAKLVQAKLLWDDEALYIGAYLQEDAIWQGIAANLPLQNVAVHRVTLTVSEQALRLRLQRDVDAGLRAPDVIERSVARLPLYDRVRTVKLDVSSCTARQAAQQIAAMGR